MLDNLKDKSERIQKQHTYKKKDAEEVWKILKKQNQYACKMQCASDVYERDSLSLFNIE